jgi:parallel beta-helix repeat protein
LGAQRTVLLLLVILCFAVVSSMLVASTPIVKADSTDSIRFSSGAVIFSPLNRTYNSRFLTLNLTFGIGLGVDCSLNYSIDEKYDGPIPLVAKNPTELHIINEATGLVTLPELSEGSHRLTINVLCGIYDYHGANPPGAPFKPTSPGSADYVASWAHTVYFTIDTPFQENIIYIKADGSVEGTDKIQRDGNVYTFTDNVIEQKIVVEKDNIVIDGANFTLQGGGLEDEKGIDVPYRHNVTIRNVKVTGYRNCVFLENTASSLITNSILDNEFLSISVGVRLVSSHNNKVNENIITKNNLAIYLCSNSSSNSIFRNVITANGLGIHIGGDNLGLTDTVGNIITENNITNNDLGVYTEYCGINTIHHNNFINNTEQWDDVGFTPWPITLPISISIWDDGREGNYWSDYTGTDNDGNGVGDTPYILNENNQDNYPLMKPVIIPEFPSWIILPLFLTATLVVIFYSERLRARLRHF